MTEVTSKQPTCPHGHVYGTCLMCYHDLVAEQQSEIERLRGEAEAADEQLAQLRGFAEAHKNCRGTDETKSPRESQLEVALGQWLHDFGSTNELSQRTRILLGIPHPAEKASALCNHDLQSPDKTLKATGAPRWGWRCTVCEDEWYPEVNSAENGTVKP